MVKSYVTYFIYISIDAYDISDGTAKRAQRFCDNIKLDYGGQKNGPKLRDIIFGPTVRDCFQTCLTLDSLSTQPSEYFF